MKLLAEFFALVVFKILERLGLKAKEVARDNQEVAEEGARAEEAAENAVSELQKPEPKTPINENQEAPSVKKWADFFKHRRNRKRP